MKYDDLLVLRREAYAEHTAKMTIPAAIDAWARKMEYKAVNSRDYEDWCEAKEIMPSDAEKAGWCKTLGIWYQRLPLIDAFMVLRYGEEPVPHWPTEFSTGDIQRADNWFAKPKGHPGINEANRAGV